MWSDRSIPGSPCEEGAAPSLQGFLWNVGAGGGRLLSVSWFMLWFYGFCFAKVLVWGWVSTRRAACAPQNSWQFCGRMALLSYQLGKLSKGSSWPMPWGSQCCRG